MQKLEDIKAIEFKLQDKLIKIENGRVAGEAGGSLLLTCEDTILLATCCYASEPKPGTDFFPLTVDFEEKLYAIGKIPGSYNRREGKPNDKAVLSSRLIDRPIRPLFPEGFHQDVQITITVLSSDQKHPTDVLGMFGASCAVALAGLPVKNPMAAVRVGLVKGSYLINPTYEELSESQLDLIVAGTEKNILMIEAGANFVKEEIILGGIAFAQEYIQQQIQAQQELCNLCGVQKQDFVKPAKDAKLQKLVEKLTKNKLTKSIDSSITDKSKRDELVCEAYKALDKHFENLAEKNNSLEEEWEEARKYVKSLEKHLMRKQIMDKNERVDGRKCNEIRPIWSQVGLLPRTHGSGLFTRGSTQVLSAVTLGSGFDAKSIDGIWPETQQTYFHHYNFPAYSVGEARSTRSTSRREIGHGALAERAIIPALPSREKFPYVIRVVSEVLSSNGSTSMASTCASCLALMDAGVPLTSVVAGIAMGLILEDGKCAILSDIQGLEDFLGDMDFKVTGNQEGITALQLDLKLADGISLAVLKVALAQALEGRLYILDKMLEVIDKPREELAEHAPHLLTIKIDQDQISGIIGPSGKNIKKLIEESGVDKVDIADDGLVTISGNSVAAELARSKIETLTLKIKPGEEYKGFVARKLPIGLFVEIAPGKVGLLKAPGGRGSHLASGNPVNFDEFDVDQEVVALIEGIDTKGRINLAHIRKLSAS